MIILTEKNVDVYRLERSEDDILKMLSSLSSEIYSLAQKASNHQQREWAPLLLLCHKLFEARNAYYIACREAEKE